MLTIKYTDPSWNDEIIEDLGGAVKITRKSGNATIEDATPDHLKEVAEDLLAQGLEVTVTFKSKVPKDQNKNWNQCNELPCSAGRYHDRGR